jgi:hypothetical protein
MSVYASRDLYRIVAADGGGVRVVMPGGLATTALEEWYPSANAAAEAIADAIKGGMPAFEIVDETAVSRVSRA